MRGPKQDKFDKMFKIMGGHLWSNQMNFKCNANARILHNSASIFCNLREHHVVVNKKLLSELFASMLSEVMASWSMWRPGGQTPWSLPGAISSKHHDFKLEGTTHTAARDLVTTSKSVRPFSASMQWFSVVSSGFQVFDVFDRLDTIRYLDMV